MLVLLLQKVTSCVCMHGLQEKDGKPITWSYSSHCTTETYVTYTVNNTTTPSGFLRSFLLWLMYM